jgi:SAM-dependent methyltransferase
MEYDPVKKSVGRLARRPLIRRLGYFLADIVFLRAWYVKAAIRKLGLSGELEILDAGSGFGQYSTSMAHRFPRGKILGLEIDPVHVDDSNRYVQAIGLDNCRFERADLNRLDFENRFDLVLSVDVLEHIPDDRGLLIRFCKALKPGGFLVVSTPTVYRKHGQDASFVAEHARDGYSNEDILDKFGGAGFRIREIRYGYGFWGDLSWRMGIRNVMRWMSGSRITKAFALLYAVLVWPIVFVLMVLDFFWRNRRGTGVVVTAQKPETGS